MQFCFCDINFKYSILRKRFTGEEDKLQELSEEPNEAYLNNQSIAKSKHSVGISTRGLDEAFYTEKKSENIKFWDKGESKPSNEKDRIEEFLNQNNKQKKYIEEDNREICEAFKHEKAPQDQK